MSAPVPPLGMSLTSAVGDLESHTALADYGPCTPTSRYGTGGRPYIVAHRGGAGVGPENTMMAFARTVELGVRYLETDVRVTADGVPVAFHDATLDRVTDMTGRVTDHSWSSVRQAMVLGTSQGIPPMADLLGSFPGARFMIDVKSEATVRPLAAAINHTHAAHRVCVSGGWDDHLALLRELCGPHLSLALGWRALARLIVLPSWLRSHRPPVGTFAHVPWHLEGVPVLADPKRRRRIMAGAESLGVSVMAWTLDTAEDATAMLDAGAAGIITDRPDVMCQLWADRGLTPPWVGAV